MSPFSANTYFGTDIDISNPFGDNNTDSPKVGIDVQDQLGLFINNISGNPGISQSNYGALVKVAHSSIDGRGVFSSCNGGEISTGVLGSASAMESAIGVRGVAAINGNFSAGIYGTAGAPGSNNFAGYFDGDIMVSGTYNPSDSKLKKDITNESNVLETISLLRPVTYTYKKTEGIALSELNQHGFISQEMEEVFPELTKDIMQPVFDEDGNVVSELSFKGINYVGLISVLTAGIQELNTELIDIREELAEYKANDKIRQSLVQDDREVSDYSMEQNIPNPFNDRSIIRYQLAPAVNQASITIFDLNGGFVKDYPIDENKGEITILASEIGKGMFIYSLTRNGQEIMSKRMIVR
jgi:hypothetical protein